MAVWAFAANSWHIAAAQARDEVVVLLVKPDDAELVTRIQGQTRDLGIRVRVSEQASDLGAPGQAERLARASGARFVAQVRRAPRGGLEVRLYDARARSMRARHVPSHDPGERFAGSAELEAAALVLRSELTSSLSAAAEPPRAIATPGDGGAGGAAGPSRSSAAGAGVVGKAGVAVAAESDGKHAVTRTTPPSAPAPERVEDEPSEPPEASEASEAPDTIGEDWVSERDMWSLRGGLRLSAPVSESNVLAWTPLLGVRRSLGVFELGLEASSALPFELAPPSVELAVRRHMLVAEGLAVLPWARRFRLLAGLRAGAALYVRSTQATMPPYESTESTGSFVASFGAQVELQWFVARHVGLSLAAGLDAFVPQLRFDVLDQAGEPHEIASLRSVEPWTLFALFATWGH